MDLGSRIAGDDDFEKGRDAGVCGYVTSVVAACSVINILSVRRDLYKLEIEPECQEQRVGLKLGGRLVDWDLGLSPGPFLAVSHDGDVAAAGPDRRCVDVSETEVQLNCFADRYRNPARQHPGAISPASVGNGREGEFAARTRAKTTDWIFRVGKPLNVAAQPVRCDPRPTAEERRYCATRRELPTRKIVESHEN